uniref:Uncharacterized protein n=1 Tax=Romanomermis culicivorax TaxID=13658 RepID=A0A915KD89_ROMCU
MKAYFFSKTIKGGRAKGSSQSLLTCASNFWKFLQRSLASASRNHRWSSSVAVHNKGQEYNLCQMRHCKHVGEQSCLQCLAPA